MSHTLIILFLYYLDDLLAVEMVSLTNLFPKRGTFVRGLPIFRWPSPGLQEGDSTPLYWLLLARNDGPGQGLLRS